MNLIAAYTSPIDWLATQLESLPRAPLRRAIVITSSERLAHAVRRELCFVRKRPDAVAGVTFTRPAPFALNLLARAGRARRTGWEMLRPGRIEHLLLTRALTGSLAYFRADQLGAGAGYADAMVETIADLEAGGLTPDDLDATAAEMADDRRAAARLRDVGTIWRRADADRGDWRTVPQILAEAAELLEMPTTTATPPRAPRSGQLSFDDALTLVRSQTDPGLASATALPTVFAVFDSSPSPILLRLLRVVPDAQVFFHEARPLRTGTHRWRSLAGLPPPEPAAAASSKDELGVLRRYLFETPENLVDSARPRSPGVDGTVDLEEHPGIETEIEATSTWVMEQIAAGTPLERIAVVIPEKTLYAALVIDRLAAIRARPAAAGVAAHVAGGIPLSFSPAGRRFLALLTALARGLDADSTLRILPALRRAGQSADAPASRLSPSRAAEITYEAGIAGGARGDIAGIKEWGAKLHAHRTRLAALVAAVEREPNPDRTTSIEANHANRWLRDVEPILPAIEALQALAEQVIDRVPFARFWESLHEFCNRHYLMPPEPAALLARLQPVLGPALADEVIAALPAPHALRWIERVLQHDRFTIGRFGEPRVFIGTPMQAAGLEFDAVRIIGLAEGGLPRTAHDDPIVPDGLRARIDAVLAARGSSAAVPRLADRVLDDLHGVFRVIAGAKHRLALSIPRQWVDRSEREVSGIALEVATALARTTTSPGEGDVPTASRLRSAYFAAGETARRHGQMDWPVSAHALLSRIELPATNSEALRVPATWFEPGPLALGRIHALHGAPSMHGHIGEVWKQWPALGTTARPLSASALNLLLGCPHRFLLERLLHWKQPPPPPTTDAIDPGTYGTLFHRIAEELFDEAGAQMCRREGSQECWERRATEIADARFSELLERYPLRGAEARASERQRLRAQIASLVRDEWERPPREFVAAELPFGHDATVSLHTASGDIYLWGAIDRLDRLADGSLSVRDIKTGRVRDLAEEEANAGRDLQIGIYTLIAEATLTSKDGESQCVSEAAYVHPSAAQEPERCFRATQLDGLRQRTQNWLRIAADALAGGTFVRTSNPDDCRTCPFVPTCGDGAQADSERRLAALPQADPLTAFLAMKRERKFED